MDGLQHWLPNRQIDESTNQETLGRRFNLVYDGSYDRQMLVGDRTMAHPHYLAKFCENLSKLASHQAWLAQPGAMAVCLQYVVKCRTNDQRQIPWPKENHTTDKFFDVFHVVTDTFQNGTMTITKLHDEVERQMKISSPYSRIFRTIENLAFDDSIRPLRTRENLDDPYIITTEDVMCLLKALDQGTNVHSLPPYHQAGFFLAAPSPCPPSSKLLPADEKLGHQSWGGADLIDGDDDFVNVDMQDALMGSGSSMDMASPTNMWDDPMDIDCPIGLDSPEDVGGSPMDIDTPVLPDNHEEAEYARFMSLR
ncbi:hypothetical protein GGR54DRAFT_627191 [Hypoxylon sp. NC1633]|nr:hypothetical protein GGR54DRAFT_627191 [Hypoxylon sp. NC1633]